MLLRRSKVAVHVKQLIVYSDEKQNHKRRPPPPSAPTARRRTRTYGQMNVLRDQQLDVLKMQSCSSIQMMATSGIVRLLLRGDLSVYGGVGVLVTEWVRYLPCSEGWAASCRLESNSGLGGGFLTLCKKPSVV